MSDNSFTTKTTNVCQINIILWIDWVGSICLILILNFEKMRNGDIKSLDMSEIHCISIQVLLNSVPWTWAIKFMVITFKFTLWVQLWIFFLIWM